MGASHLVKTKQTLTDESPDMTDDCGRWLFILWASSTYRAVSSISPQTHERTPLILCNQRNPNRPLFWIAIDSILLEASPGNNVSFNVALYFAPLPPDLIHLANPLRVASNCSQGASSILTPSFLHSLLYHEMNGFRAPSSFVPPPPTSVRRTNRTASSGSNSRCVGGLRARAGAVFFPSSA